ncbi:MAG TPA: imidazole glycerol phosphate synthase subunit HisH [Saprospiraceae bacterium]|nr:imidazole glycerol phosphate synthase subunit HisH [Saprospiraceae bacterium]
MIAIIDYNAGNTRSVINALQRLGANPVLTADPAVILSADKVILPGVGHAATAMEALHERNLVDTIKAVKVPFLGVCLGMQIMLEFSEEGDVACLGLVPGTVTKFKSETEKIPHMGWNTVIPTDDALMKGIDDHAYFYFVHSYYVPKDQYTIAETSYILPFCAAMRKDQYWGVQFHPEKSASVGEKLLQNFLNI